jgi:hypothetical protein
VFYGDNTDHIYLRNNIEYESWGNSATSNLEVMYFGGGDVSNWVTDYNLAFDPDGSVTFHSDWTGQTNEQSNLDPDFVNYASDNFLLDESSNATGNGGPLTAVTSSSDTGTSFDVAHAGWFRGDNTAIDHYGGNLIVGDTITIGTDERVISSISGQTITVSSSLTWAQGDLVYFGDDTTPDIGAYPEDHVPLTEATISQNGSDYTVTPDGDTRWVVFFQDGIPHTVDNGSPYTATISSGEVTANAYPLYASKTTYVEAAEGQAEAATIGGKATIEGHWTRN